MELHNTQQFLYDIASGTVGDLASTAGMAGNDDLARTFAAKYQPAARAVVNGIGKAGEGVWSAAHRLIAAATDYLAADNAGAAALLGKMTPAPAHVPGGAKVGDCEPSNASASLPEAVGGQQTSDIPVIGHLWPQGDPDKLRHAAATWTKAAELIDTAQVNASKHIAPLAGTWSGDAATKFGEYQATLYTARPAGKGMPAKAGPFMEDLSGACRSLAQACDGFADAIDDCRTTIIAIGVGAGLITAAGIILTVFTFGGSDAAAVAADAALVAEGAVAVAVMETAATDALALAAVAEAEAIVASAAARVLVGAVAGAAVSTVLGGTDAQAAAAVPYAAAHAGVPYAASPAIGPPAPPIPPPVPPPYGLNTPAEQAAARTWMQDLHTRDPLYGSPADQAYQVRMAGAPERLMSGAGPMAGITQWADGYRPADGAVIDAKNIRDPGCTPRTLNKLQEAPAWSSNFYKGDRGELAKYAAVIANPANHVKYLEIDTNNPDSVEYWQFLAAEQGTKANVRYVP